MVQTRSAAKRQQTEQAQGLAAVPKDLDRERTIIEITPSATGQGTHIRWLRPPQRSNEIPEILSPDMTLDPRFATPAPETPAVIRTPPKLSRQRRIGNPGIFNTGTTVRFSLFRDEVKNIVESARVHGRDLLKEFERYAREEEDSSDHDVTATDTFANVVEYRPLILPSHIPSTHVDESTPLSLGPHGTHLNISLNELGNTGHTALMLGPHGTHLLESSQEDSQGVQGLGPNNTVLVGPDGRAIVPGIRPGH